MDTYFNVTLSPSLTSRIAISVFFYLTKTGESRSALHQNEIKIFLFWGEDKDLEWLVFLNKSVAFENLIILVVKNAYYTILIKRKQFSLSFVTMPHL